MKIIKGFENEDIVVSDFGEWVGKNYIDYKAEYESNQKVIKILFDENKQLKDNWIKLKEIIKEKFVFQGAFTSYEWNDLLNELLYKMKELEQGSDSNE